MTAAPPKPATRIPVPWDPWCWLEIQVSSATGTDADPDRVGYWQADTPDTADPRYTVWQADNVTIPPTGHLPPSGYGEWVEGGGGSKHDPNWAHISWQTVDCELLSASFSTGNEPWDWNASPGNGSLQLVDPLHKFTPLGPGSGVFDDIGADTPIRVIAHLTAAFDEVPANAAKRLADRVLITGVIRTIEHTIDPSGQARSTITFSEPHIQYARVNVPETTLGANDLDDRLDDITDLSDDPSTTLVSTYTADVDVKDGRPGGLSVTFAKTAAQLHPSTVAADLWTELCKAINSQGMVTALAMYQYVPTDGTYQHPAIGSPHIVSLSPFYGPSNGVTYDSGNMNGTGYDVRSVSQSCSPPNATFNYTAKDSASRKRLSMSPIDSIAFIHHTDDLANQVSVSATGGTAVVMSDQESIDRWYLHTYQRHDLVFWPSLDIGNGRSITEQIAWRILERLHHAVHSVSDCTYVINHPRDFEFAVGAVAFDPLVGVGTAVPWTDHPPLEPGRWLVLDWDFVSANLRLTKIAHEITPSGWTVTHSYEVHNPTTKDSR